MNTIKKYIWLIDLLKRKKRLTRKEISDYWRDSDLCPDGEVLEPRTLGRWIEGIADVFGIHILCDAHDGYSYYIDQLDDLRNDVVQQWAASVLSVTNLLADYKSIRNKIVVDPVWVDLTFLRTVLDAIKERKRVRITYHRFQEAEARPAVEVEPFCVRYFMQRWYAVVRYSDCETPKIIAFDRMVEVQPTDVPFKHPDDFDAESYFSLDYGMGVGFNVQPADIILKVNARQRNYIDTLPLHPSQKEIETHEDYSLYHLFMKPSTDLARAILPFGSDIRVVSPDSFRELLHGMASKVAENNEKEN